MTSDLILCAICILFCVPWVFVAWAGKKISQEYRREKAQFERARQQPRIEEFRVYEHLIALVAFDADGHILRAAENWERLGMTAGSCLYQSEPYIISQRIYSLET